MKNSKEIPHGIAIAIVAGVLCFLFILHLTQKIEAQFEKTNSAAVDNAYQE